METLALPGLAPFTAAMVMVILFLALELGLTALGADTRLPDGPDVPAAEMDLGPDPGMAADAGLDPAVADTAPAPAGTGLLGALGLHDLPLMAWLALLSACFAAAGFALQAAARALAGGFLGPVPAVLLALPVALVLTRGLARTLGRLFPRETTAAISERSFGRRRGTVTVGVARAGQPAQVRFTDGHGNTHYLMAEPLDPADEIPAGSEVLILRLRNAALRLVRIG